MDYYTYGLTAESKQKNALLPSTCEKQRDHEAAEKSFLSRQASEAIPSRR